MDLILLTFGSNLQNHSQANFAILSFLKDKLIENCYVVTDSPDFYLNLKNRVTIIKVDEQDLKEWRGSFDFSWRIKIQAIRMVINKYPVRDILYVDSDTFLVHDLKSIEKGFSLGQVFMHQKEGFLSSFNSKTEKKMWRSLEGKTFQGITITQEMAMWNAGVIGIPGARAKELTDLALNICDDICATNCPRRLVEQFAFSLALNSTKKLVGCSELIAHYWGNKNQWNMVIQEYFANCFLKNYTFEQQITAMQYINYKTMALVIKERSIKLKLINFINKKINAKKIVYFN